MAFQEADLENLIVDLIKNKGYEYVHGDNLNRQYEDALLEDDLKAFLSKKYAANGITPKETNRIIMSLKAVSSANVYDANKTVFTRIVDGENLVRDNRSQKDFWVKLIDFNNIDNNIFKVCNQVIVQGHTTKRIPDTIIYINGLPMVVWEFKSTIREDATIYNAFEQLSTRYLRDIPELFKYNAFVVISDGVNSKMGSLFTDYEHFYAWRKVNSDDSEADGIKSLFTMIDGLFRRDRLIDVIHNFIYFPDENVAKELKIVANYPQYFAATKLLNNILLHKTPEGDGKGGTYFGTTGCGKSWCMVFLTRLLVKCEKLKSPTIVIITDRADLDEQLSDDFVSSKNFIGDKDIVSVESRERLGKYLDNKASGGIFLTTIQKFTESLSILSLRDNIICISDEAHRSQVNLDQKISIDNKNNEVRKTYGFAKYLHDSLPNATYVGFTGTPIDETINVFGPIVEQYTMKDSIKDGITVKLVYDGRFVKATLDSDKIREIEQYYKNCLKNGANEYQIEQSKKESISIKSIIGDTDILKSVAINFIQHYECRVKEGSTVAGKCMFVCADRLIAWNFYKIVKSLRPEWVEERHCPQGIRLTSEEEKKIKPMPMMKIVMTPGKDDPKELFEMLGNKKSRKEDAIQFKQVNSNFKIAIVVDMWLTGFDVPFLDTMYIDKLLVQQHSIIQTISRVNRAYPGKTSGLIVDFIGIKSGINLALRKYCQYQDGDFEDIDRAVVIVKDQLDVLDNMLHGFDSSEYFTGSGADKLRCLNEAVEFVQKTKELESRFMSAVKRLSKAFGLCNAANDFNEGELDKIHFYIGIRSVIFKLTKGHAPDTAQMNQTVKNMVQEAILANDVEELFTETTNISEGLADLFDDKYLEKINKIPLPNTKVKVLQQLLNQAIDEFKKVNKIKAMTFSERLRSIVDSYNSRSLDDLEFEKIIDEVTEQLINLIGDLRVEKSSFEKLGINYEEKAFYDVLVAIEEKYKFDFPEESNIKIAKEIAELVTDKTKFADWSNRLDIKADLESSIIECLAENGFPPMPINTIDNYEEVYYEVVDVATNFKKYCNE